MRYLLHSLNTVPEFLTALCISKQPKSDQEVSKNTNLISMNWRNQKRIGPYPRGDSTGRDKVGSIIKALRIPPNCRCLTEAYVSGRPGTPKLLNRLISGFSENRSSLHLPGTWRAEKSYQRPVRKAPHRGASAPACGRLHTSDLGQGDPASSRLCQGDSTSKGRRSMKETAFSGAGSESHFQRRLLWLVIRSQAQEPACHLNGFLPQGGGKKERKKISTSHQPPDLVSFLKKKK